jgi:hypothetical protein
MPFYPRIFLPPDPVLSEPGFPSTDLLCSRFLLERKRRKETLPKSDAVHACIHHRNAADFGKMIKGQIRLQEVAEIGTHALCGPPHSARILAFLSTGQVVFEGSDSQL